MKIFAKGVLHALTAILGYVVIACAGMPFLFMSYQPSVFDGVISAVMIVAGCITGYKERKKAISYFKEFALQKARIAG